MRRHAARLGGACLVGALFASACGGAADRPATLGALAGDVIVPAYLELDIAAQNLLSDVTALCEDGEPSIESLEQSRSTLTTVRERWAHTEAMWVGPVMERRSWAVIDWPIDRDEIELLILDGPRDPEGLATRVGADQRGLRAVEYIVFGAESSEALAGDRCEYLVGITTVMADEVSLLVDDWTVSHDGGASYADTLGVPDENGLDAVVNDSLFLLEAIADAELGTALGAMEGAADLDALGEGEGGLATTDIRAHLTGLRGLYLGNTEGPGLRPLLGDDLASQLESEFDAALDAASELDTPLTAQVAADPETVGAARDAIKEIQTTVATEVVARLGVTIGFSDADGDSG